VPHLPFAVEPYHDPLTPDQGRALAAHPHRNLPPTATGEKRKIDKTNPNPISGTNPPNHQGTRDLGTMS
jgi:hypothetical protein